MELSQVIPIITAIVTAPLSAWFTAVLLRKKYNMEVEQLKAQITATKADTKSDELENVRKGISILMNDIVEPLKKEINAIRKELARFRKALEKGNDCKHYDLCPIRGELQRIETNCDKQSDNRHGENNRDPT